MTNNHKPCAQDKKLHIQLNDEKSTPDKKNQLMVVKTKDPSLIGRPKTGPP